MILVNVLMFVAIAAGLVLLMVTREESALDRATRLVESSRALAAVRGGELSAVVALRRDLADAPDTDNAAEPWAALSERAAPDRGGHVSTSRSPTRRAGSTSTTCATAAPTRSNNGSGSAPRRASPPIRSSRRRG